MFRFRRHIEVIFLKFYRDSLLCVVILGIAGAIRHGNLEKHGTAAESGRIKSCRGCGMASNCVPAGPGRRYQPGVAVAPVVRSAVLPVSFK